MKAIEFQTIEPIAPDAANTAATGLPLAGLLALAMAGFITVLTEALPAGLLTQMSKDLAVSESLVGQLVTIYAIGSLLAAIPLVAATRGWRRRPLLQTAIGGFFIVNTITALSDNYVLTMVARLFAGVFAGLLWALLAGFASRMVADSLRGRAIAIAMIGTPLALSLGIPLGTLLASWIGWRFTFGVMSLLTLILLVWVQSAVPDFSGKAASSQLRVAKVFGMPGVKAILGVTFAFVLAHTILYTYIAPFLAPPGMSDRIDLVLFVFGVMAFVGTWVIGVGIDRWSRRLVLLSVALFMLASVALGVWNLNPAAIFISVGVWGLAFGGVPTLFQAASANATGEAADVGQALMVTVWNLAIAGGGALGGLLLDTYGASSLPWALLPLLLLAGFMTWRASMHGFPASAQK